MPTQPPGLMRTNCSSFTAPPRPPPAPPLFALTPLGPATPVLGERELWATAVTGAQPQTRITLTYPVLESSRDVIFLVTGAEKRDMFARLQRGDQQIPAGRLRAVGTLWLLADAAAAGAAPSSV